MGQAHTVDSQSGFVYSPQGTMVTLIAGTHGYAMGYVLRKYEKDNCAMRPGSRRGAGQSSVWGGIATSVTATEYKDPLKVVKRYGEKDDCTRRHR